MKLALPTAALLLTGTTALADLTPQDIVNSWQDYYEHFGGTLAIGDSDVTGSTTQYNNITAEMKIAGNESLFQMDYMTLRSRDDGSLDIRFSPDMSLAIDQSVNGNPVNGQARYNLGLLDLHAEGTPGQIRYTFSAPGINMEQSQKQPDMDVSTAMIIHGLAGWLETNAAEDMSTQTAQIDMESLWINVTATPQGKPPVYIDHRSENVSLNYDMSLPDAFDSAPLQTMLLRDGTVFGMALTTENATTTVDQRTRSGMGRFTMIQSGFELTAAYAENAFSYGLGATDASLALANTPAQPVDFTAGFSNAHWGLTLPVHKADTPSPFALSVALDGFTLGPEIWARIDPEATLSQAPASFAFSVNGTAKLFVDLFDQTALTALRGAPFELRALSLSSLNLDFEGMGLTGDGDVTFNNERLDPMSGLPEPAGVLDFSVNGALGLLDKIGRLGFMDPMVIIGAKGALGMFATPGAGPDSFTSRIEFSEGGHISVNGQQVK